MSISRKISTKNQGEFEKFKIFEKSQLEPHRKLKNFYLYFVSKFGLITPYRTFASVTSCVFNQVKSKAERSRISQVPCLAHQQSTLYSCCRNKIQEQSDFHQSLVKSCFEELLLKIQNEHHLLKTQKQETN